MKILASVVAIMVLTAGQALAVPANPQPSTPGLLGPASPAPSGNNNTNSGVTRGTMPNTGSATPNMNTLMPSSGASTPGGLMNGASPCNFTGSVPDTAGITGSANSGLLEPGTTGSAATGQGTMPQGTMGMTDNAAGLPGVMTPSSGTTPCN